MLVHSRWLHACICFIHPKECWEYKKSSSRNLAKVRIKTAMCYIEVTLTAGASGLQRWKQKSLVSHYSCFLPKVLEFLPTVSVSYHPSVQTCRWVGNAPFTHDFYGKRNFSSTWVFKMQNHIANHVPNSENSPCSILDSGGESVSLGGSPAWRGVHTFS